MRDQLVAQVSGVVGTEGGGAVRALVESARAPGGGGVAVLTGVLAFVLAATGAFLELQAALDGIWRVTPVPGLNLSGFLKDRLRSFAVMIGVGLLLLVSLAGSASLAAAGAWLAPRIPQAPWVSPSPMSWCRSCWQPRCSRCSSSFFPTSGLAGEM